MRSGQSVRLLQAKQKFFLENQSSTTVFVQLAVTKFQKYFIALGGVFHIARLEEET